MSDVKDGAGYLAFPPPAGAAKGPDSWPKPPAPHRPKDDLDSHTACPLTRASAVKGRQNFMPSRPRLRPWSGSEDVLFPVRPHALWPPYRSG